MERDGLKRDLVNILCCPVCKGDLSLSVARQDADEILAGTLHCGKCKKGYAVDEGIPNLLPAD